MNSPLTFSKEERISSEKEIALLFEKGLSFISYPLRVLYCPKEMPEDTRFSVLVSVSKRKFKRAVKRNRVKRLIRETYRQNKSCLSEIAPESCPGLNIAFVFVGNVVPDFKQVEAAMVKALSLIKDKENITSDEKPD